MDNNNFNFYNNEESEYVTQQLPPNGFRPNQPTYVSQRSQFNEDFDQGMPRIGGQTLPPPPNFTPELPGMERGQSFAAPEQYGAQFRGGMQPRTGFSRRCLNRFTFIWLINGNSFWFFPIDVRRQSLEGFRWVNGRWVFDRINLRRILFSVCF